MRSRLKMISYCLDRRPDGRGPVMQSHDGFDSLPHLGRNGSPRPLREEVGHQAMDSCVVLDGGDDHSARPGTMAAVKERMRLYEAQERTEVAHRMRTAR